MCHQHNGLYIRLQCIRSHQLLSLSSQGGCKLYSIVTLTFLFPLQFHPWVNILQEGSLTPEDVILPAHKFHPWVNILPKASQATETTNTEIQVLEQNNKNDSKEIVETKL